jgi:Flp pilus assembly protein TadG
MPRRLDCPKLKISAARSRRGSRRPIARFGCDVSGASALEFAIIAIPLLWLLFASLQVGLMYSANFTLEGAAAHGARFIRTGQAQNQNFDANDFKAEVCDHLNAMLSCGKLMLDVRRFDSFSESELTEPLDASGNMKTDFSYDPGVGGDVVIVRAFYQWELPAGLPSAISVGNMNDNSRLLIATAAFRNEPFKDEGAELE